MIGSGQSFELSSSNYTTGIKCEDKALCAKYVATMQTNKTFASFAKLKKALKDKPVPDITNEDVRYFSHNFRQNIYIDEVYNIDLKSAYATILLRDGFIDEETYKYICSGTKQERLASVGMLASRKEIFTFKNGKAVSEEKKVSENSGFFFLAAQRTFDIMDELKRMCEQSYLFTWVDGIYFTPNDSAAKDCMRYVSSIGFKATFEKLTQFEVRIKQDKIIVTFVKDGKQKLFNLPPIDSEFKSIITENILRLKREASFKIDTPKSVKDFSLNIKQKLKLKK